MDTGELIRSLTDELEQHTIEIRHEIHANPELSFHEFATSRIVCRELDRIGIPYEESPCKPGIIATIDSGKPGKFLMLRAANSGKDWTSLRIKGTGSDACLRP